MTVKKAIQEAVKNYPNFNNKKSKAYIKKALDLVSKFNHKEK
tara:strand:+ start:302 stop:427 length:126 start_codon:yes stop_codon:yes gene_type:complete